MCATRINIKSKRNQILEAYTKVGAGWAVAPPAPPDWVCWGWMFFHRYVVLFVLVGFMLILVVMIARIGLPPFAYPLYYLVYSLTELCS